MDSDLAPPAASDPVDAGTRDLIRTQQVRLLYTNLRDGLRLSCLGLILVVVSVRILGPVPISVRWWASLTLAWILAGFVMHWLYRRQATDDNLLPWAQRAAFGSGIAGVLWGSIGFCLLDPAAKSLEPLFIAVVCLVALGVYAAYACYLPAMYSFVLGVTLTFSAALLMLVDRMHVSIVVFLLLTAALALLSGRNFNRLLTSEILTRTRNDRLVRDLTAKQAEVESANMAKTRFLAAASHDLRQPVHAINIYGEVLRAHVRDGEGLSALNSMQRSIHSLDGLFESIEDIAKFEAGIVTARLSDFPLERVLATVRADHAAAADAKAVALRVPPCEHVVRSDPVLLGRILGNLVSNAIRYTDTGSVRVEVERAGDATRITVRDTGIGIPQDRLDDVFREFVQLHNPERDRSAGLGLGLSIVKRLADLLGHPLDVRSQPGTGSAFSITVPLAAGAATALSPTAAEADDALGVLAGAFVLVIDDEAAVREATGLLLRGWRCHVLSAGSGDEALALIEREERYPDLILSDYRLRNDESGIDVIERVRRHLGTQVPALLISGDIAPARVKEAFDRGLTVLHKPVPVALLRDALASRLPQRLG